jgi:flagellar protein FliO/FliZ
MTPVTRPIVPALAAGLLICWATAATAQRFPRQLEDVKLFGKGEVVEFHFSQPYQAEPTVEVKPGYFALNFSGTGSSQPIRALRPKDESLYKEIKVVENRYSTTVGFTLKDPRLSLQDRLSFTPQDKVLKLQVSAPSGPAQPEITPDTARELLQQMEHRIAGEPAAGPAPAATPAAAPTPAETPAALPVSGGSGGEFFYPMVTMVVALVIIVAALYGVLFLYNRFFAHRLSRLAGGHSVKQLASFHIGPRQRVVVLEINGEIIACGVTPGQISYLTHLDGKGPAALGGSGQGTARDGATTSPTGAPPTTAGPGASGADLSAKPDPVQQFAEALKQKVRSLKRIN